MNKRNFLLSLAALLIACGGGGGGSTTGSTTTPPPEAVGQVINTSFKSTSASFTYDLQVFLPQSYATGSAPLPVIYVTEGDAPYGNTSTSGALGSTISRFDTFKAVVQRRASQVILVGISGTARRDTDFLLPTAPNYLKFIAKELAPSIESQYRADPNRRVLSGLSHGGYFVIASLVLEGQAGALSFSHYLATDPSYGTHVSTAGLLAFEAPLAGKTLPATLFMAGATGFNAPNVNALYTQMIAQANPGLTVLRAEYQTTHVGADVPAFEEALTRFFP